MSKPKRKPVLDPADKIERRKVDGLVPYARNGQQATLNGKTFAEVAAKRGKLAA